MTLNVNNSQEFKKNDFDVVKASKQSGLDYSQDQLQDCEDERANLLNSQEGEEMYEKEEEDQKS